MWAIVFAFLGAAVSAGTASAGSRPRVDPAADLVLGQVNLSYTTVNFGGLGAIWYPQASTVDSSGHLYVVDTYDNRVLGWQNADTLQNGDPANIVIGQPDPFDTFCETSRTGLCFPSAVATDSRGNLYVADSGNNRVLEFTAPFNAGVVAGQPAATVLGQGGNFTRCSCSDGSPSYFAKCGLQGILFAPLPRNPPLNPAPSAAGLCAPGGIAFDSADNLYVADSGNSRILIYLSPAQKNGVTGSGNATADRVIGQPDFSHNYCNKTPSGNPDAHTLCYPGGVTLDHADNLYVADTVNSRVLEYDSPLKRRAIDRKADRVFGQQSKFNTRACAGFSDGTAVGPDTLC